MFKKLVPVIIILLAVVFLISCVMILRETAQSKEAKEDFDALTEVVTQDEENTIKSDEEVEVIRKRDLTPLFDKNPDCIGWIFIEDTTVDYPVMQTPSEPQKYLRRSFDGEYSSAGVPFLQETVTLDSDHLIIYGHNMKNGSMFADIIKYRDKNYLDAHPIIEFETQNGLKMYEIFAVVTLKSNDSWYQFGTAEDEDSYLTALASIKERSLYDTGNLAEEKKQLLTLSTCYGPEEDDRLIVIAIEQ